MSARLITSNLAAELASAVADLEQQGKRVRPLVAGRRPFGRKLRVGVMAPDDDDVGSCGMSSVASIKRYLDRIGYPPCRVWGADPPGGRDAVTGCPTRKKLCIIPFPLQHTVTIGAGTGAVPLDTYTVKAKVWYWPLMFVDGGTETQVTVEDLTYTGDSVFENGDGFGAWTPSALFPPEGNYSVMPGLPAFDNSTGLVFSLANSDAAATRNFAAMFLGVSIRN